ncbi:response regulator transcription factor [Sediminispirochaeta smaragdinae]|uniref:Two component transcriptional regulator, winged helix family n=1 Tax=Sediminispirochaeta smaragdinae (strain DSM 11293 / JCM 15392 / SEBR 4228) TaxID=573413 RepID=E1R2U6_SEDSS|nr:response regulator transcription factor [Sediminispirochaeta smaragdinae]ADK80378.1 two component transcriptional regulator, winged helix family [Sediminispirochaeta smaragdinae DSM 11293]
MSNILIIEDEPGLQMTLEDRLRVEGYEVTLAGDGLRGEAAALTGQHDLIILDIMLPGRDGFSVCSRLRKAGINTPVLMLTARGSDIDIVAGLRQGADDYMAKPFDMNVLLARVEALLRRATMASSALAEEGEQPRYQFGTFLLDLDKRELYLDDDPVLLSAQEYRLLEYLVRRPNKVLSRDQIMDEVWSYSSEATSRTVDVHVAKLRQKLGETAIPRHILTIRGRGYKFIP